MSDVSSLLTASVLRNLSDKLYEKRKNAALEVESVIRQLTLAGDHERISAIINTLTTDFALSPQANHRKGGLIGLAAATVGLAGESAQHLEQIVPPVLKSLADQDSRVRYYACEALYNIAKVARGEFILFFNQIFDALCKLSADSDTSVQSAAHLLDKLVKDIVTESDQFSIEEFIPLLRERMNVLNPYVRQFLVGWITVLDSVPDIDMLGFLPDFLDGLFNMLSDQSREIRQQADSALAEFLEEIKNSPSVDYGRMAEILVQRANSTDAFTRLTAITWINEFVKLGGDQLVPYYAEILGSILPCISDKEEKIRVVAKETNEELRLIEAELGSHDIDSVLKIAERELMSVSEDTKIEALRWMYFLLDKHRTEVLDHVRSICYTLLDCLGDPSNRVVLMALEIYASIAKDDEHFRMYMDSLLERFHSNQELLEKRGTFIIRTLSMLLNAQKVYEVLAGILKGVQDLEFATKMVQALNLILLTASELAELRALLKQSLSDEKAGRFFYDLYTTWCHSPMATISLCLLAQAYPHATMVIQSLGEEDINVKFLVQVDKLVRLIETPVFTYLRLQLLDPGKYHTLIKTLNGLLLLLPQQSIAFKILRTRLKTVPPYTPTKSECPNLGGKPTASGRPCPPIQPLLQNSDDGKINSDFSNGVHTFDLQEKLNHFRDIQRKHREHRSQFQQIKLKIVQLDSGQGNIQRLDTKSELNYSDESTRANSQIDWHNDENSRSIPQVGWHN